MAAIHDETAATAVEYALFLAFVAAVIIATIAVLGTQVLGLFQSIQGEF